MLYINFAFGFYSAQNTNVYPKGTCLGEKKSQSINFQKLRDFFKVSKIFQIKVQVKEGFLVCLFCFVFTVLRSFTSQFSLVAKYRNPNLVVFNASYLTEKV